MKTVFIHIGTLKTGSSSVQNFLWDNNEKLYPYKYLNTGLIKKERHIGIRHYNLYKNINNENLLTSMVKEIDAFPGDGVVISYEGFVRFDNSQISILREWLDNYEVKVIFYVRRQDKFIESLYLEYLKNHRYKNSFKEFIQEPRFIGLCDYYNIANSWADFFGLKNIIVKNFEKHAKGKTLIDDFLSTMGISMPSRYATLSDDNLSLNISSARFLASFNKSKLAETYSLNFCRKIANNLIQTQSDYAGNDKPVLFGPESRRNFVNFYRYSNGSLFDKFGCEKFSEHFDDKEETDISCDPEMIRYLNAMGIP